MGRVIDMDYTAEQYAFLQRFETGIVTADFTTDEFLLLSYFEKRNLVRPRADISNDLWVLTEDGKRVLFQRRQRSISAKIQAEEKRQELLDQELARQEDIRKEQEEKRKRFEEAAAEADNRKTEKRADQKFQIVLAVLSSGLSFLAGLLVEYFTDIVEFLETIF